jgi:transposase/DNA-binding transcriptional ArsR family regulator
MARVQHVKQFKTTVGGLLVLCDWLAHGATHVVMEATGDYWKPVWHVLEDDFELMLVNARHVKQVPGRKTDVSDAAWLCQLAEAGLLRPSFVPPKPIRDLRALTRYRRTQIAERKREAQRLHKALEDTGIKLDRVATDILGKSGRAMLDALVSGTTDPEVLADLARGKLRKKIPALREALEGRFEPLHALLIGAILAHLDFLDEQIDRLSEAIEAQLRPFASAAELLCTMPGVQQRTAELLMAEIGTARLNGLCQATARTTLWSSKDDILGQKDVMGRATAHTPDTLTGLDGLLGGRAKSGIVRALADRPSARLTDLIRVVGMSKSAVTNALTQLEESGAVRTHREGREVVVEAAERSVIVELVSFDRRVHHQALTMPVPQEDMDDDALAAMEAYFAEPVGTVARASHYDDTEAGLPVTEDVWKLPQGLPA